MMPGPRILQWVVVRLMPYISLFKYQRVIIGCRIFYDLLMTAVCVVSVAQVRSPRLDNLIKPGHRGNDSHTFKAHSGYSTSDEDGVL